MRCDNGCIVLRLRTCCDGNRHGKRSCGELEGSRSFGQPPWGNADAGDSGETGAMSQVPPSRCRLCNAPHEITPAGFRQVYPQKDAPPVLLDWWECRVCKGWFAYPVPSPQVIERHWETVAYLDAKSELAVAQAKEAVQRRILAGLSRWTKPGPLLDFGCNFGQFLLMARQAGWTPSQ